MDIKTIGKLLALSAGGLAGATGAASADDAVKGLPEDVYDCRNITAENRREPPPPLVDTTDPKTFTPAEREFMEEAKLPSDPCPAGKVAYGVEGLPQGAPPHPSKESGVPERRMTATAKAAAGRELPPGYEYVPGYFYVDKPINGPVQAVSIEMSIHDPWVEPVNIRGWSHSIGEIAMKGEWAMPYSAEVGWRDMDYAVGPDGPRLFTYVNKDNFTSHGEPGGDCYDCHFVPVPGAEYVPGGQLPVSADYHETMRMGIALFNGDWWIWVGDQYIGYLEHEFWPEITNYSRQFVFYGEVYDTVAGRTDMGTGVWGHEALGAAVMNDPESGQFKSGQWTWTDEPRNLNSYYNLGRTNRYMYDYWTPWDENNQRMWKYGGPGTD